VGGGEQQRSCSPETALQLQRYEMEVEEILCAVTSKLGDISKTAFLEGMMKLKERANNVLNKEECILKNKNKLCPYKKLSVFCNSCLKPLGRTL
jgi:hypothetical protein